MNIAVFVDRSAGAALALADRFIERRGVEVIDIEHHEDVNEFTFRRLSPEIADENGPIANFTATDSADGKVGVVLLKYR